LWQPLALTVKQNWSRSEIALEKALMLIGPILWVILGLIAGWAAGKIMKGSGYGVVIDIVLGVVGALVGGFLLGILGIHAEGLIGTIIVAIIGAVFLIWLSRQLKKG
jgi:uncharacterized membrane protein YeaQ/YmgE (transglycosylase-associated protein family)